MSEQWPGGFITKNPPTPSGDRQTDTATGVWTLNQAAAYRKQNLWPTQGNLPRLTATGGTVVDYNGYRVHRFTTSANFVITSVEPGAVFEIFIIGGGGGGNNGSSSGPAGGAGGAYWNTAYTSPAVGAYPVIIGAGGAGALAGAGTVNGNKGGNSSFDSSIIVAAGGGSTSFSAWTNLGSEGTWPSGVTYSDGGCGGGTYNGGDFASHPLWGDTTDRGRSVYNSIGAFAVSNTTNYYGAASGGGDSGAGGGGGGIGGNGVLGVASINGGDGGVGLSFDWVGTTEWMGGGGGGGVGGGVAGIGGSGVGGNGGLGTGNASSGAANTGSGGGGSGNGNGGNGANGVCIIRYAL